MVMRVGELHSVRQPGLTFLVPLVDSMVLVDIRDTPRTGDKQDVITRDNVTVSVNATIFSQVVDPKLALFSVSNYFIAIDQLSRTTLRAIFGGMSLDDALSQRERINAQLQAQMESLCKGEEGLRQQLALYQVYYNFVLPHASLRQPWAQPVSTKGTG